MSISIFKLLTALTKNNISVPVTPLPDANQIQQLTFIAKQNNTKIIFTSNGVVTQDRYY